MDDCRSDPCTNGGTCLDGISSYTCHCSVEWTGLHCEVSKQNIIVTTRARGQVMFSVMSVCLSVCLSVCPSVQTITFELLHTETSVLV